MPKHRNEFERVAGLLISAVQKEAFDEMGASNAEFSLDVLGAAHDLLQARCVENAKALLGPRSVAQHLGEL